MTTTHSATIPRPAPFIRSVVEIGLVSIIFIGGRIAIAATGFAFPGPVAVLLALLVATILMRRDGESWHDLGLHLPRGGRQWIMLPLLLFAAIAGTFLFAVILFPALADIIPQQPASDDSFAFLRGDLVAFLLFTTLVAWGTAAFGEEMLFRGFLFNRLEALFGGRGWAVGAALIGQALLFGLCHGYQGWYGILLTGSIGLVMGIVYLSGRRWLAPVILAHGIIDTISLSQIYASG